MWYHTNSYVVCTQKMFLSKNLFPCKKTLIYRSRVTYRCIGSGIKVEITRAMANLVYFKFLPSNIMLRSDIFRRWATVLKWQFRGFPIYLWLIFYIHMWPRPSRAIIYTLNRVKRTSRARDIAWRIVGSKLNQKRGRADRAEK